MRSAKIIKTAGRCEEVYSKYILTICFYVPGLAKNCGGRRRRWSSMLTQLGAYRGGATGGGAACRWEFSFHRGDRKIEQYKKNSGKEGREDLWDRL